MIRFRSRIILFRIQEMALELCTQQRAGRDGNTQEGKQLKFAPQLNKFA